MKEKGWEGACSIKGVSATSITSSKAKKREESKGGWNSESANKNESQFAIV